MEAIYKPFVVWERLELTDRDLGALPGDVPHQFDTEQEARKFIMQVKDMLGYESPYIREIGFTDYCHGIDFGSWSNFFLLESRDYARPLN